MMDRSTMAAVNLAHIAVLVVSVTMVTAECSRTNIQLLHRNTSLNVTGIQPMKTYSKPTLSQCGMTCTYITEWALFKQGGPRQPSECELYDTATGEDRMLPDMEKEYLWDMGTLTKQKIGLCTAVLEDQHMQFNCPPQ